jgi:hypothetical protein
MANDEFDENEAVQSDAAEDADGAADFETDGTDAAGANADSNDADSDDNDEEDPE